MRGVASVEQEFRRRRSKGGFNDIPAEPDTLAIHTSAGLAQHLARVGVKKFHADFFEHLQ